MKINKAYFKWSKDGLWWIETEKERNTILFGMTIATRDEYPNIKVLCLFIFKLQFSISWRVKP